MSRKKTHAEFVAEIKGRPLVALDEYVNRTIKIRFRCHIDGNEWYATPAKILFGRGCPKCGKRSAANITRGSNKILEDHVEWLLVDISTPKFPDATMAIDTDVFEAHTETNRNRICACSYGGRYIYATYGNHGTGTVRLHRDIIDTDLDVDHIVHGTMSFIDNRRSNLREATRSQNLMNMSLSKRSTSGISGVSWDNINHKWRSSIRRNGKTINLGRFDNIDYAIGARQQAEREYYGEYTFSVHN